MTRPDRQLASRGQRQVFAKIDRTEVRPVRKRAPQQQYVLEEQINPFHAALGLMGAASLAWGAPRLRSIGPVLAGAKYAAERSGNTTRGARIAGIENLRGAAERRSAALGGIGRTPLGRATVGKVPKNLRPAAASLGGLTLLSTGTPLRQQKYRPSDTTTYYYGD